MSLVEATPRPMTRQKSGPRRVSLHLYTVALENDSRFLKQAMSLLRTGLADRVILVGRSGKIEPLKEEVAPEIRLIRFRSRLAGLPRFKPFGCLKYLEFLWRQIAAARSIRPAIIQCHSVSSLPAAVIARSLLRVPLVYDARELETECNGLHGINRAFTRQVERTFIKKCDSVLCVSDSIADWYASSYRIPRPFVVRNIPDLRAQKTLARHHLRQRLDIGQQELIFIYSGALGPGRFIEPILKIFQKVRPDRHLVFMGFGPLESAVRSAASSFSNIHFLGAVPPLDILRHISGADVGFAAHLEPTCLNHRYALPNKFFEYLLAGVPVWVTEAHEEMAALVRQHGFGWITRYGTDGIVKWVNELTTADVQARRQSALTSQAYFSWEQEEKTLLRAYLHAEESMVFPK